MIDARELRIGNKIFNGTQIWTVDWKVFKFAHYTKNHFEGIPLTEDILLKAGFKQGDNTTVNDSFYWIMVGVSEMAINPNNGVVWITKGNNIFNNPALIKHLHSLQNIYWCLSGQELDIKLQ